MNPAIVPTGFYTSHRIALLVLSLLLMGTVLEMVRRSYLKEKYALLWLLASLLVLLCGLFPSLIVRLSALLSFQYITLVFIFSFLFLLILVLAFSVAISRLSERTKELAQEVALLNHRLAQKGYKQDSTDSSSRRKGSSP